MMFPPALAMDHHLIPGIRKAETRILGFGRLGFEDVDSWGTVKWSGYKSAWVCAPNEATEYDPEPCHLKAWLPLPPIPDCFPL